MMIVYLFVKVSRYVYYSSKPVVQSARRYLQIDSNCLKKTYKFPNVGFCICKIRTIILERCWQGHVVGNSKSYFWITRISYKNKCVCNRLSQFNKTFHKHLKTKNNYFSLVLLLTIELDHTFN